MLNNIMGGGVILTGVIFVAGERASTGVQYFIVCRVNNTVLSMRLSQKKGQFRTGRLHLNIILTQYYH